MTDEKTIKPRRRPRPASGYARGTDILYLEIDKNEYRAFWSTSFSYNPDDLNKKAMTVYCGGLTLPITCLFDRLGDHTKSWALAKTALARYDDDYFHVDLVERRAIRMRDTFPVLH